MEHTITIAQGNPVAARVGNWAVLERTSHFSGYFVRFCGNIHVPSLVMSHFKFLRDVFKLQTLIGRHGQVLLILVQLYWLQVIKSTILISADGSLGKSKKVVRQRTSSAVCLLLSVCLSQIQIQTLKYTHVEIYLALIKLSRIYEIPKPTYVGGET